MNAKWITPAVTAMDSQGHVDMEANKAIYDFLIEKGMDGLLLLGSIGEFFAIPTPEKKRLIREALAHINHRTTVYVGTCEMNLEACVELSNYALEQGADGAMVISPYYFSLPDSAILNFYDTLAQRVQGPVLLYNFPSAPATISARIWCWSWPHAIPTSWALRTLCPTWATPAPSSRR